MSWFELFYDLAIVATLVALNESFLSNPDPMNAVTASVGAAALFSVWLLTSLAVNTGTRTTAVLRGLMLVQMAALIWLVAAIGMSTAVPPNTGLLAYGVALFAGAALWWRHQESHRTSAAMAIAGTVALAGYLLPSSVTWLVVAATTLIAAFPAVTQWVAADSAAGIEPGHLSERMGLFVLIVLGLSFGQLVVDLNEGDAPVDLRFFVLMFAVMFAIWWVYFGLRMHEHPAATGLHRRAWITAHYLLLVGIAGTGDVISGLAAYPDGETAFDGAAFLGVSVALILLAIGILVSTSEAGGSGPVIILGALAVAVLACCIVVDAINLFDLRPVTIWISISLVMIIVAVTVRARHLSRRRRESASRRG